jgi:EmrB/QacA subfamily drug resistance transporter
MRADSTKERRLLTLSATPRFAIVTAALLALFLAAMDALVMSAAMPTIVSELGGLHLYSWVYSSYFLARAVSLPIFGKLADLFPNRNLFIGAIGVFILASVGAGCSGNMIFLIITRVFQGIGAGGIFALVYIVLADVSSPRHRGRTMSFASSIWGIASVIGPTLGGFIVTYFSWRWIFFINIPLGLISIWTIGVYLSELRPRREHVSLDFGGVATLSTAILAFLFAFLLGGRSYSWSSPFILGLLLTSVLSLTLFVYIELRAKDPILPIEFFRIRGFSTGNGAVFFSSFSIFSMFAFAPLFIQGAQGRTPVEVGIAMLSLSLGWSLGSLALGQGVDRLGRRYTAAAGALFLMAGCGATLGFTLQTSTLAMFTVFFVIGVGMGWVSLSTILVVQASVSARDLGVATASNQFARTLGGTVGVGVCGSFIAVRFSNLLEMIRGSEMVKRWPAELGETGFTEIESLLHPDVQARLPGAVRQLLQDTLLSGITGVFWTATVSATICLVMCLLIPNENSGSRTR